MSLGVCPAGDGEGERDDEKHVIDDVALRRRDARIEPRQPPESDEKQRFHQL